MANTRFFTYLLTLPFVLIFFAGNATSESRATQKRAKIITDASLGEFTYENEFNSYWGGTTSFTSRPKRKLKRLGCRLVVFLAESEEALLTKEGRQNSACILYSQRGDERHFDPSFGANYDQISALPPSTTLYARARFVCKTKLENRRKDRDWTDVATWDFSSLSQGSQVDLDAFCEAMDDAVDLF